jgi:hypothetical protein
LKSRWKPSLLCSSCNLVACKTSITWITLRSAHSGSTAAVASEFLDAWIAGGISLGDPLQPGSPRALVSKQSSNKLKPLHS